MRSGFVREIERTALGFENAKSAFDDASVEIARACFVSQRFADVVEEIEHAPFLGLDFHLLPLHVTDHGVIASQNFKVPGDHRGEKYG